MTRLFGTNGIRGVVGKDMTPELAVDMGKALGTFFGLGTVALARDTRLSGPLLAQASASGLMAVGCDVVDLGVVPTPAAQLYVAKIGGLRGGVVITASHNPREFNGIKALDALGMEMGREDEEAVEAIHFERRHVDADWSQVGSIRSDGTAANRYLAGVLSHVDADAIRKRAFTVVVDPGNGAGSMTTPYLLAALGCRVLSLNAQPDGAFPGRLPEPVAEHLGDLLRLVVESKADLGVAHDGDADRAIFVDEQGRFLYGDRSFAILADAALQDRGGTVVTPVSTSNMIDDIAKRHGAEVVRTKVGAPIVARYMFETGATFGGEENGGIIFPEHQFCRDGGMAVAKLLEVMALAGKPLSALADALPRYFLRKASVEVPAAQREEILSRVAALVQDRRVERIDGVKIHAPDGWVLVRPSGTEPIFRIYAEAKTEERAAALAQEGTGLVRRALMPA